MTRLMLLVAIYYQAIVHGFDPRIIAAQIFVESSFRSNAVNRRCIGLMQINYKVWSLNRERLFDPYYNIAQGVQILKVCMRYAKGDLWRALEIYNAGFKYNGKPYVNKIKSLLRQGEVHYGRK